MEANVARMLRFFIHIEAKLAHTLRILFISLEQIATAEAYAHRDGAHTIRIPQIFLPNGPRQQRA